MWVAFSQLYCTHYQWSPQEKDTNKVFIRNAQSLHALLMKDK